MEIITVTVSKFTCHLLIKFLKEHKFNQSLNMRKPIWSNISRTSGRAWCWKLLLISYSYYYIFGLSSSRKANLLSRMEPLCQKMCSLSAHFLPALEAHLSHQFGQHKRQIWEWFWQYPLMGQQEHKQVGLGLHHWVCITFNTGWHRGHRMKAPKDHPPPQHMPKDSRCWNCCHDNFRGWNCSRNNWCSFPYLCRQAVM